MDQRARNDINDFIPAVLKDEATGRPIQQAAIHRSWQNHVSDAISRGKRAGVMAPFKHGKTPQLVVGRTLWYLGHDTRFRIKIVSNTDKTAMDRLASISRYIETDPDYQRIFPNVKPAMRESWSKHAIIIDRPTFTAKDASVEAFGILSSVMGGTCDILIFDDPVDFRNAILSPAMRDSVIQAFKNQWISRLIPGGKVIYTATAWHNQDLTMSELIGNPEWSFLIQSISEDFGHIESRIVEGKTNAELDEIKEHD